MILENTKEFFMIIKPNKAILGLDVGVKRIGIACSDDRQAIAFPKEVYERQNTRKDIGHISRICRQENVAGIVIGFPLSLENQEVDRCQMVRSIANKLYEKNKIPIMLIDERFSTLAVTKVMLDAGVRRKERHEKDDKLAASYILQTALDSK